MTREVIGLVLTLLCILAWGMAVMLILPEGW